MWPHALAIFLLSSTHVGWCLQAFLQIVATRRKSPPYKQSSPDDLPNITEMLLTLQGQIAAEFKAVHLNICTVSDRVAHLDSSTQPTEDSEDVQSLVNATSREQSLAPTTEYEQSLANSTPKQSHSSGHSPKAWRTVASASCPDTNKLWLFPMSKG